MGFSGKYYLLGLLGFFFPLARVFLLPEAISAAVEKFGFPLVKIVGALPRSDQGTIVGMATRSWSVLLASAGF